MPKITHEYTYLDGKTFCLTHKEPGVPPHIVVESGVDVLAHWEHVTNICIDHLRDVLIRIRQEIINS